jgi:hypothetical protein
MRCSHAARAARITARRRNRRRRDRKVVVRPAWMHDSRKRAVASSVRYLAWSTGKLASRRLMAWVNWVWASYFGPRCSGRFGVVGTSTAMSGYSAVRPRSKVTSRPRLTWAKAAR